MDLSIIIPFSPKEEHLADILSDLKKIPFGENFEIILVGESDGPIPENLKKYFVKSNLGRAVQLNNGSFMARGKFLWFLHADSRITSHDFKIFYQKQIQCPNDLTYFNLKFYPRSKKMRLNEMGAKFRSDIFKLPFGDQGLGLSKENFQKLGGFPITPLGEDIGLVCIARKNGIALTNNGAKIYTSARKYEKNGWIKTTLIHLYYSIKLYLSFWFGAKTI